MSTYYVPGSLLGVKDILVNKTRSLSDELYILAKGGRQYITQQLIKKIFQTVISLMGKKPPVICGFQRKPH